MGKYLKATPGWWAPCGNSRRTPCWRTGPGQNGINRYLCHPVPIMRLVLIQLLLFVSQTVWSQAGPQQLFVLPDTALQGPAPTDTTRNAVNGFLRDFYRDYPTDFEYFHIPSYPLSCHSSPGLDFRHRK